MAFARLNDHKRFNPERYQKNNVFATERSAVDVYCLLPGQSQKVHTHAASDKYYLVMEGTARVSIGGEERDLGPGEAALAAPGVEHGISNAGAEPLMVLVFQAPKTF